MVFFGGKKQTIWHKNKLNTTLHFFAPLLGSAHSKICIFLDDKNLVKPVFQRLNVCHPWDPNQTPEQLAQEYWNFTIQINFKVACLLKLDIYQYLDAVLSR